MGLIAQMLDKDVRALSKILTLVENDREKRKIILDQIANFTGKAIIIGITGPPGVGKSTTVNALANDLLNRGLSVGVIAVDPSSPYSNGAILGDRIRMTDNIGNENLFIRSLASRGKLGGLSQATNDCINVLDAFGKDVILVETVGIGQSEFDIIKLAHTTLILLSPGAGDEIQAMKSGIMEVGDIFVINKSDLPGADRLYRDIQSSLNLRNVEQSWEKPILKTISFEKKGIEQVTEAIFNHLAFLKRSGKYDIYKRRRIEIELKEQFYEWIEQEMIPKYKDYYKEQLDSILERKIKSTNIIEDFKSIFFTHY